GPVDQLCRDSQATAGLLHTALDEVTGAQLSAHLLNSRHRAFVGEGGLSGDDHQVMESGKIIDDVLANGVADDVVLLVSGHVGEWKDSDGRQALRYPHA